MKRKNLILLIIGAVLVVIFIYSFNADQTPEEYAEYIAEEREEQDSFMRYSEESPFHERADLQFKGLKYYDPNQTYKVKGRFTEIEEKKIFTLPTSDNKEREYLEYGYAQFDLGGKSNKLLILEDVQEGELFLAFGDATSASDTYGGGRYLDVEHGGGKTITLDFNLAYNPFCAFAADFSCPLPPRQNLLDIAIEAGEKNYD